VQRTLKELGYYEAAIDGQLGPATQTAIRTFQIDRGLPVTGKIDSSLEKELGLPVEL
jgi:peptidoglycan hydrolase-like protein with peptidoglycan-binding domain